MDLIIVDCAGMPYSEAGRDPVKLILHILRNPDGWSDVAVRWARTEGASIIEQQAKKIETLEAECFHLAAKQCLNPMADQRGHFYCGDSGKMHKKP